MYKTMAIVSLSILLVFAIFIIHLEQPQPIPTGLNTILNIKPTEAKPLLKYLKSNEKIQFKILKDECIINNNINKKLPTIDNLLISNKNKTANCKEILSFSKK